MWQNYLFLPLVSLILTLQSLFSKLYSNKYTGEVSFSSLVYLVGISRKRFFSAFRMPPLAWVFALCACVIATLAANLLTYVLSLFDNSAVVNATNNGLILIFTAISSVLLFREKMGRMKILGAVLCVISIVLLNL